MQMVCSSIHDTGEWSICIIPTVSTKFRECMLFWCASFLTRELRYCDGAFCTQKFKYICYTEAFEDDSVSTFNYFVSVKTLTQAGENFPCTGDIQLTSRSEGRCTYLVSSLQMALENLCSDTEFSSPRAGIEPIAQEASAKTTELPRSHSYQHMLSG